MGISDMNEHTYICGSCGRQIVGNGEIGRNADEPDVPDLSSADSR